MVCIVYLSMSKKELHNLEYGPIITTIYRLVGAVSTTLYIYYTSTQLSIEKFSRYHQILCVPSRTAFA